MIRDWVRNRVSDRKTAGASAPAGPLGRALRLFRGFDLGVRGRSAQAKRTAPHRAGVARGAPSSEALRRLELERQRTAAEVAKLEAELERLHDQITSSMSSRSDAAGAKSLEQVVEESRRVRDGIQEKRLELLRVERKIARERQLRGEAKDAAVPAAPVSMDAERSPRQTGAADLTRRRALSKALRECKLSEPTEYRIVKRWAAKLLHADAEVRRDAVSKIAKQAETVVPLLLFAAEDPNQRVRLAALGALSTTKHRPAADVFRRFLRDPNAAVRVAALRSLARLDPRAAASNDLLSALEDSDSTVRKAALDLCATRREHGKIPARLLSALAFALYDADAVVRVAAADALGATGDERAALALIRAVADESHAVSEAASKSLCAIVPSAKAAIDPTLAPIERARVLKAWWIEARVGEAGGTIDATALVAAARKAAADAARVASERKVEPAVAPVRAPAPEPASAPAALGVRPAAAAPPPAAAAPRPAPAPEKAPAPAKPDAAAAAPAAPATTQSADESAAEFESILGDEEAPAGGEDKEAFESVFEEGAEDGSDEEFEKVLGDTE